MKLGLAPTAVGLISFATSTAAFLPSQIARPGPLSGNLDKRQLADDSTEESQGIFQRLKQQDLAGEGVFEQLIDHDDPDLGTFDMRYWWNAEHWSPGGPVIVFTPGEQHADGFNAWLSNATIIGLMAEAVGGASVVYEHRYYGESSPGELTVENLMPLTIENVLKDGTHFAKEVNFPFDPEDTSDPSKAPWVYSGGSYSGALVSWTATVEPGTFWAYHASSAIVETIEDFWFYWTPTAEGMQQNCTTDVQKTIAYMDDILFNGSDEEKLELKTKFGLQDVKRDDDFMIALYLGPVLWLTHTFYSGYAPIFEFCDFVENRWPNTTEPQPGAEGVGTEKAVAGYAKWVKERATPGYCASFGYPEWSDLNETACFRSDLPDSPHFHDVTVRNPSLRQYMWSLCREPLKWWFTGAPEGEDELPLISRVIRPDTYWERQCSMFFPDEPGFTVITNKTVDDFNEWTGGWTTVDTPRIVRSDGEFDPWRQASVSSTHRPGGPWEGTDELPVHIIKDGVHTSDFIVANARASEDVKKVMDAEIEKISEWVDEFYEKHGGRPKI